MFLCDYNAFLSIESLCWTVGYQIPVTTVKLITSIYVSFKPGTFYVHYNLHHITNAVSSKLPPPLF